MMLWGTRNSAPTMDNVANISTVNLNCANFTVYPLACNFQPFLLQPTAKVNILYPNLVNVYKYIHKCTHTYI